MGRSCIAFLGFAAWLHLMPEAAAQQPATGAYDVLASERLLLLKKRELVLQKLAQYQGRARAYEDRNRRVAAAISGELTRVSFGKFAADGRADRLLGLRHEVSALQREWARLDSERRALVGQLNGVTNALARVQAAMAALKAAPTPTRAP